MAEETHADGPAEDPPPAAELETPTPKAKRGGGKRRALRALWRTFKILALVVLALVVVVLALVVLLLYSNAALTTALDLGLDLYNDRIAGEIRIREVDGRLADDLALRGIVLVDADELEVVTVGELHLKWSWWGLLSADLDVASLTVAKTQVDLRGDFADLSIPGPPPPPSTTIGPSLPLHLKAEHVEVLGFDLRGSDGRPLVGAAHATLRAVDGSGTDAALRITQAGAVLPGVVLEDVKLGVTWGDAVLQAAGAIVTDVGRVDLLGAVIDVANETGDVSVSAKINPTLASQRWAPPTLHPWVERLEGAPELSIHGALNAEGTAALELRADLPGLVEARLVAGGPLLGAPDVELRGRVTVSDRVLPDPALAPAGALVAVLDGNLHGDSFESFDSALRVLCVGCGELGGLDLRLQGARRPGRELDANVRLASLGVDLEAGASMLLPEADDDTNDDDNDDNDDNDTAASPPIEITRAGFDLKIPSIQHVVAGLKPLLAPLFELPALAGHLATAGTCEGEPLECSATLSLDDFAGVGLRLGALRVDADAQPLAQPPLAQATILASDLAVQAADLVLAGVEAEVALGPSDAPETELAIDAQLDAWATRRGHGDHAQLAAKVHLGPTLRIALDRLDLAYRGLAADLQRPTEVTIADRRYTVDELDLKVAKGRLQADGVVDRDGSSDLRVTIDELQLARLAKLVPSLRGRVGGRLSLDAQLQGPAAAPTLKAGLQGRGVRLDRGRLGDLDLHAELAQGRARASLELRGDLAKRAQVKADAHAKLDLGTGAFAVKPGAIHVEATIDKLALKRLEPWLLQIDPELEVGGTLDLKADLSGSASSPAITIEAHGRDLRALSHEIGTLDLKAKLPRGGDAQLDLRLARRGAVVIIDGQVLPIRLDLTGGGLRWRPRELHQVRVEATRIVLRQQLEGLVDTSAFPLKGVFDLEVSVAGPMGGPMINTLVGDVRLRGHRLAARELDLGELDLRAHVDKDRATADLDLAGPLAAQLSVHAEAPLHIVPTEKDVRWLPEGEHILTIDGRGLDLSRLKAFSPQLDLRGLVDVDIDASANRGLPVLKGTIAARDIAYQGHAIGGIELGLDFRDRLLRLTGQGDIGAKGALELHASAPVKVDLRGPTAALEERRDGRLSLRVTGIDTDLIGAVYPLPPELATYLGFTLTAKTGPDGYAGDLALRGSIAHRDVGAMPIRLDVAVTPVQQRVGLDFGPLRKVGDMHLELTTQADLNALVAGRAEVSEIPLQAAVQTEGFGLGVLKPLLPEALYDLTGELKAKIKADGTIAAPGIQGELALVDAAVTIVPLQQRLRKIGVEVSADGTRIVVDRISAISGRGSLTGDARLELTQDGYKAGGEINLGRFPLVRPGIPQMQISGLITADAKSDAKATQIDVKVSRTEVSILGSTGKAADGIPTSDSVHYVDGKEREPVVEDIAPPKDAVAADIEVVPTSPPEESKRLIFKVALTDPLEIVGNKLAMRWQGQIRATDTGTTREVSGQLVSKDGFIEFTGNRFKIDRGVVTLPKDAGEIAPFINVTALTEVGSTQVTLTVRGRLPKPELILESSPSMSQGAILTLLLTGEEEIGDGEDGQALAAAASLLSAFQNAELRNYVNERTGIDQIGVTFEDGVNRPVVSVGKRLSDDLYVETAMRINPRPRKNRVEARIEYELAPHWTLETHFGDAAVGGIDLFWEKILGNPKNPARRKR